MGGTPVEGIPWQASSYSPVVGDQVTILWDQSAGMLVTGTISTVRAPDAERVTVEVSPELECGVQFWLEGGTAWTWRAAENRDEYGYQLSQGAGFDGFSQATYAHGTYLQYPAITIPTGASDPQVSVRIRRSSIDWNVGREAAIVSPVLYGHATPLPTANRSGPDPYFATDAWRAGALTFGDEVIYPLPEDWQTGLLNRSLTGLAVLSEEPRDFAIFIHDETRTAEDGSTYQVGTPGGNANLIVAYTPPAE